MNILFISLVIFSGLLVFSILFHVFFIAGKKDHGVEIWKTKDGRRWIVAYIEQAGVYRAHVSLELENRHVYVFEADTLQEAKQKAHTWFKTDLAEVLPFFDDI